MACNPRDRRQAGTMRVAGHQVFQEMTGILAAAKISMFRLIPVKFWRPSKRFNGRFKVLPTMVVLLEQGWLRTLL